MLKSSCGATLKSSCSDIENDTKSEVGFSALRNVDTALVSYVEATLQKNNTTPPQRYFNVFSALVKIYRNQSD